MAGEGSSNIGDVTATLRADLRDFVTNVQAAAKNLDALAKSSAGTQQAITMVSNAIDGWTIRLATGKISTDEFAQKIELLKTNFQDVVSGVDQASESVGGFTRRTIGGYSPITRMTYGMVTLARESLGVQRGFASAAEGALLLTGLPLEAIAALAAGIALVVAAYDSLTKVQREHEEQNQKLLKQLRQEADADLPADVRAMKQARAANEELTAAIQHRIDTLKKMPPGLQGIAGGVEDRKVQAAESDADLGTKQVIATNFDKLIDRAKQLQVVLKAGLADPAIRKEADQLSESLVEMGLAADQADPKVAELGTRAKEAGDALFNTLYPAQEKVRKSTDDYFKDLGELLKLNVINIDTTNEVAKAIDTLTAKIASGHETRQQMIRDIRDLDALIKESGLGQLQNAPIEENLGPMQPAKLPSNSTVEITTKMTDTMKELRRIVARGVDDIVKTMVEGILGGTQSLAQALIKTFERAIAQLVAALVAEKILDPLYKLLNLSDPGGKILGGGGDSGGGGTDLASAIIGGATSLLSARSASVMVPLSGIPAPALPSPAIAARDTYWRSVVTETVRVINANGGRVLIG